MVGHGRAILRGILSFFLFCTQAGAGEPSPRPHVEEGLESPAQPDFLTSELLVRFDRDSRRLLIGEDSLRVGGFVKADFLFDFDRIGDTDRFDTRTIATDGSDGNNARLHARQTRLNIEYLRDSFRGFVETDFFGPGSQLRLRHAYAEFGPVTVGQTWSTFVDPDILPNVLDFEAPTGALTTRRALIRLNHELDSGWQFAGAVEDPESGRVSVPAGLSGTAETVLPDFVGEAKYANDVSRFRVASFISMLRWRPDSGPIDDELLWGVSGTALHHLTDHDVFKGEVSYGDGLPKFRGVSAAGFDSDGGLLASTALAWMVALEHEWSPQFTSTVTYSNRSRSVLFSESADAIRRNQYLAANLLWSPKSEVTYGIEYLYGTRKNKSSESGNAHRVMMSAKLAF